MIDETPDITNNEQVSFCLRYVDDSYNIHERFIGLYTIGNYILIAWNVKLVFELKTFKIQQPGKNLKSSLLV